VLTGYLSLGRLSGVWRQLGEYVTLGRTFYSLLLKQEAVAAPISFQIFLLIDINYVDLLEM
jgi:hypothetical protein